MASIIFRFIRKRSMDSLLPFGLLCVVIGLIYNKLEDILELINASTGSLVSGGDPVIMIGTFFYILWGYNLLYQGSAVLNLIFMRERLIIYGIRL